MADDPIKKDEVIKPGTTGVSYAAAAQNLLSKALAESARVAVPDFVTLVNSLSMPQISPIDIHTASPVRSIRKDLADLRASIEQQTRALAEERTKGKAREAQIITLTKSLESLQAKERIAFLLTRVNPLAQQILVESKSFQDTFLEAKSCFAVVMSIDIRRSTELMLKARNAESFALFIEQLCRQLMSAVTENFGVIDKFTGDGVLAFFPDFFSGADAGYFAMATADKCHTLFHNHYRECRSFFGSVLTDVGLGIGIDYGSVHLVQVAEGLTVVGAPVVYACRLSGAPSNQTLINQPAYELLMNRCSSACFFEETELNVKHEGGMLAYRTRLNGREYRPQAPAWTERAAATGDEQDPGSAGSSS